MKCAAQGDCVLANARSSSGKMAGEGQIHPDVTSSPPSRARSQDSVSSRDSPPPRAMLVATAKRAPRNSARNDGSSSRNDGRSRSPLTRARRAVYGRRGHGRRGMRGWSRSPSRGSSYEEPGLPVTPETLPHHQGALIINCRCFQAV